jgi:uncharacterized membrane protein (DUF2068 family)
MQGTIPGGLRAIIGYKLCKAAAELLGSAAIFIMGSVGLAADLGAAAQAIRRHATEAWSIALAERLLDASTAHNIFVVAMAMLADGLVTSFEGWALYRRYVWSRWLVVATTVSLIPFEVIALVHHANSGRALVLLVNLAIVVYLIRRDAEST